MGELPIRLGVSACLLGQPVRFDGGHKRSRFLLEQLGPHVEWVPVCPEVELGMGIPRPSVRLERSGYGLRLVEPRSRRDYSRSMRAYARRRVAALRQLELSGYVLQQDSPSCGMARVRVWRPQGRPTRAGRGLFAEALMEAMAELPVEEEGRLEDPRLRESFIERIFAYHRLTALFRSRWGPRDLLAFHGAHELQLLAHSQEACAALGRLVAQAQRLPRRELRARYARGFMAALARPATPARTARALRHGAGLLREPLDAGPQR